MKFQTTNLNYNFNGNGETETVVVNLSGTSDDNNIFSSVTVTILPADTEAEKTLDDLSRKELSSLALSKFKKEVDA